MKRPASFHRREDAAIGIDLRSRQLKLPTFLREYDKVAAEAAREGLDHPRYLLRLAELELIDRERRMVERRIRAARFPAVKSFDTFDFTAIPCSTSRSFSNWPVVNIPSPATMLLLSATAAPGNSGTGKTHACLALGLAACQRGFSVAFFTAAGLVHQLMEARDERGLLKLQTQLAAVKLLIVDELGYVPLSQTGAELLFKIFSQRLTGALLDRLTHHVHILENSGTGKTHACLALGLAACQRGRGGYGAGALAGEDHDSAQ